MKDGGAAFPHRITIISQHGGAEHQEHLVHDGMSLRDWFAGMALQGLLSHSCNKDIPIWKAKDAVVRAYEMADAMIKERGVSKK